MSFITPEENFLLQAALRRNRSRIISFALIGIALLTVAAFAPSLISSLTHSDEAAAVSYANFWFWAWVLTFDIALVFALIKVTDVRYWAIKKDLVTLEKETMEAPIEGVYYENNGTQTNFMLHLANNKKKTYYYMNGEVKDFRRGHTLNITYAKQSRVILAINNPVPAMPETSEEVAEA